MKESGVPADRKARLFQRLVGFAVLAAIALVAIPLLFDFRGGDEPAIRNSNIPEMPAGLRTEEILLKSGPSASGNGARDSAGTEPTTAPGAASPPARPPAQAWAVKVGSFSSEENALGLRNQLRAKGYNAFLDKTTVDGKSLSRVYVGPDIQRDRIEQLRERIVHEFRLPEAVVVSYD